jgi:hypothetical protein
MLRRADPPHDGNRLRREDGAQIRAERSRLAWARSVGRQDDEGVRGHGPVALHQQRVHVYLGDVWMIESYPSDRLDDFRQRRSVHRRIAAERTQQLFGADQSGQFGRVGVVHRRKGQSYIAQGLRQHATQTESHHRPEQRIAFHAHHELAVARDHPLNQHALEPRPHPDSAPLERPVCLGGGVRAFDPQHH